MASGTGGSTMHSVVMVICRSYTGRADSSAIQHSVLYTFDRMNLIDCRTRQHCATRYCWVWPIMILRIYMVQYKHLQKIFAVISTVHCPSLQINWNRNTQMQGNMLSDLSSEIARVLFTKSSNQQQLRSHDSKLELFKRETWGEVHYCEISHLGEWDSCTVAITHLCQ